VRFEGMGGYGDEDVDLVFCGTGEPEDVVLVGEDFVEGLVAEGGWTGD